MTTGSRAERSLDECDPEHSALRTVCVSLCDRRRLLERHVAGLCGDLILGVRVIVAPVNDLGKITTLPSPADVHYGCAVIVERHWWNGNRTGPARRDVYVRTNGEVWEVEAQAGGADGRSTIQQCPGKASAMILADAWLGGRPGWRELSAPHSPRASTATPAK